MHPAYSQNFSLDCPVEQMNYTACAGYDVVFWCTTTTPAVEWMIYNTKGDLVDAYYSDATNNSNDTKTGDVFTFQKDGINNTTLTFEAQYGLNGYWVSCTDVVSMTNTTTNETTTSNYTENCFINIPGNKLIFISLLQVYNACVYIYTHTHTYKYICILSPSCSLHVAYICIYQYVCMYLCLRNCMLC